MARHQWRLATLALLLGLGVRPLPAQPPSRYSKIVVGPDSAAWQSVFMHVIGELSPQLVRAGFDTSAQPWRIHLAAGEPLRSTLERQLRTILRARTPVASDTITYSLAFAPMTVVHDTARVRITSGIERRCPGAARSSGSGTVETVLVAWEPRLGFWGAAVSRAGVVGDRVPC